MTTSNGSAASAASCSNREQASRSEPLEQSHGDSSRAASLGLPGRRVVALPSLEVVDHAFQGERARGGAQERRGGGLDRVGALCPIDRLEGAGPDRLFDV